jgi:polyisoprenoid-binding protein YceI
MQTSSTSQAARDTETTEWTIDGSHTHADFTVRHMMVTNVRGEFQKLEGTVSYDPARLEATRISVDIDVASINTREAKRDAHLSSADFFDVQNHPKMTFRSKSATRTKSGVQVVGDLTIRGTTKSVMLEVDGPTAEHDDPWGNTRIGASARTSIKRSEFGMVWNTALEAGGVLVGDEVKIQLEIELVKKK